MRLTRSEFRGAAFVAATGVLTATLLAAVSPVQAAPATPAPAAATGPAPAAATAATVADRLGDRAAGTYLDRQTGRMVVAVTDAPAADAVRAAGASPRLVTRGAAVLDRAAAELDATARIPGTAWAVDPAGNQVVVSYDGTVSGAALERLRAAVARLGDAARLESVGGSFRATIAGGDAIYGGRSRCSLGFNVRSGNTYGFLTAGHCGRAASTWYANSGKTTVLGNVVRASFPGDDYAYVQYTGNVAHDGSVDLYGGSQDITTAADAYVGETVARSGSTTGVHSGRVTGVNATVNYEEGTVRGLIQTTVCSEPGDSGGSLFDGSTAIGLTSGGSGNCRSGGVTFFQPVTEALSAFGVSVF